MEQDQISELNSLKKKKKKKKEKKNEISLSRVKHRSFQN